MRRLPLDNQTRPMNDGTDTENLQEDLEMEVYNNLNIIRDMAQTLLNMVNETEQKLRLANRLEFINYEKKKEISKQ